MSQRRVSARVLAPAALVGVGIFLGALFGELSRAPEALAQQSPPPESILSAGDQRKQMIEALRDMSQRLSRIETKLNAPLSVKVLEMPMVKIQDKK